MDKEKLRKVVTFKFTAESEDEHPKDCIEGEKLIQAIVDRAEYDTYAWFCAKVVASFAGIEGDPAYLGCCSYDSEEDFLKDDYYRDLCEEALDSLFERLCDIEDDLATLK